MAYYTCDKRMMYLTGFFVYTFLFLILGDYVLLIGEILGFGLYESFAGTSGIESFKADLNGYLDEMKRRHSEAQVILLSPIANEDMNHPDYPDPAQRNGEIKSYVDAMSTIAESRKIQFIDLFDFSKSQYASHKRSLTDNGVHLNSYGHELIAGHLSRNILGDQAYDGINKERITVCGNP